MPGKIVVREPHEGDAYWMLGGLYEVKASTEETGGAMTVMLMTVVVGGGPPPHIHPGAETLYVLEGRVKHHMSDEVVEAGPGSFFYIPSGTLEWFEPTETSKLLVIYTPGGIDKFFAEMGVPAERRELPPSVERPDLDRMNEVGEKYGMQFKAPA
jgi:quercetin dioxygenase-like cupin family protein